MCHKVARAATAADVPRGLQAGELLAKFSCLGPRILHSFQRRDLLWGKCIVVAQSSIVANCTKHLVHWYCEPDINKSQFYIRILKLKLTHSWDSSLRKLSQPICAGHAMNYSIATQLQFEKHIDL